MNSFRSILKTGGKQQQQSQQQEQQEQQQLQQRPPISLPQHNPTLGDREQPLQHKNSGFFSRSRLPSETLSMDSLSKVNTNASYASSSANSSYHNLPQSHAKKITVSGFRKSHRHTISDDFVLDPPDDPYEIEKMFTEVMQTRDFESLPENAKAEMLNYSTDRKWMLIRQQKLTEYKRQRLREIPDLRFPTKASNNPNQLQLKPQSEPIQFITLLLNNTITCDQLKELEVYLTSEDLNWMLEFIDKDGAVCLCNVLNNLYKTKPSILPFSTAKSSLFINPVESYASIIEKESRLFRCIKVLVLSNASVEKIHLLMPRMIHAIFFGLLSPKAWIKKISTDIIIHYSFALNDPLPLLSTLKKNASENCHLLYIKEFYLNSPTNIRLDKRSQVILSGSSEVTKYEAWIWCSLRVFLGHGKMGSKVGSFPEFKFSGLMDNAYIIKYADSTLTLLKSIIAYSGNLNDRLQIRRILQAAGLNELIDRCELLEDSEVDKLLADFEELKRNDDLELKKTNEFRAKKINFQDPASLFNALWENSKGSKTGDYLRSLIQNIFLNANTLVEENGDELIRNLKLTNDFVTNITMASSNEDNNMNISINKLLAAYRSDDIARRAMEEQKDAKRKVEELEAERDAIRNQLNEGSQGLVEKLKQELDEKDKLLTGMKRTVEIKERQIIDLRARNVSEKNLREEASRKLTIALQSENVNNNYFSTLKPTSNRKKLLNSRGTSRINLNDTISQLELLGSEARDLEKRDFEEFKVSPNKPSSSSPSSSKAPKTKKLDKLLTAKEREAQNLTLTSLKKKLMALQKETNNITKEQYDLNNKELIRRQKIEATKMLEKLQKSLGNIKYKEFNSVDNNDSTLTKTLDPYTSNEKINRVQSETISNLTEIENLCNDLKFQLSLVGEDDIENEKAKILREAEDEFSMGKKVQPKTEFSAGPIVNPKNINKIDILGMKPFLGELEQKVTRQKPINVSMSIDFNEDAKREDNGSMVHKIHNDRNDVENGVLTNNLLTNNERNSIKDTKKSISGSNSLSTYVMNENQENDLIAGNSESDKSVVFERIANLNENEDNLLADDGDIPTSSDYVDNGSINISGVKKVKIIKGSSKSIIKPKQNNEFGDIDDSDSQYSDDSDDLLTRKYEAKKANMKKVTTGTYDNNRVEIVTVSTIESNDKFDIKEKDNNKNKAEVKTRSDNEGINAFSSSQVKERNDEDIINEEDHKIIRDGDISIDQNFVPPPSALASTLTSESVPTPPPPPPPPLFSSMNATPTNGFTSPVPPPPPLPFGSSMPPPPPPPPPPPMFPFGSSKASTPNMSPIISSGPFDYLPRTKKKLKQLHWEKIDDIDNSLWSEMDITEFAEKFKERGIFDSMEDLFAAFEAKMNPKANKKEVEKKSYLGQQHKQEFNICLQSLNKDSDMEVVLKILRCSNEIIEKPKIMELLAKPELCEIPNTLGKNLEPYSTEWNSKGIVSKPDKDPNELARPDRIYVETFYNLNHYWRSRMRVLNIIISFKEDFEILNTQLDKVEEATKSIEESDSLKMLFEVILLLGNYMNADNKKAFGFRLSTLQRLNFLKNQNNSMSFLQFLESIIRKDFPEIGDFVEELKATKNASKISIEHLEKDCLTLISSVTNIDSSLSTGNLSNPGLFHPDDKFLKIVYRELPEMRRKVEKLENKKIIILERFNSIMKYFKEDPEADEFARNTFFKKFSDFIEIYQKVSNENIANEEVQKKIEQSEKIKIENSKLKVETNATSNIDLEKSINMLKNSGLPERRNRLKELIVTSINSASKDGENEESMVNSPKTEEGDEEEKDDDNTKKVRGIVHHSNVSPSLNEEQVTNDSIEGFRVEADGSLVSLNEEGDDDSNDGTSTNGLPVGMLSERLRRRLLEGSRRM